MTYILLGLAVLVWTVICIIKNKKNVNKLKEIKYQRINYYYCNDNIPKEK